MPDIFIEKEFPLKKPSHLPLRFARPIGISFATQGEDEEIYLFLRKHFVTNLPWIFATLILIFLPVLFFFFSKFLLPLQFLIISKSLPILIAFYYLVIFGIFLFVNFIDWYFNVYIVTNQRVVDVDFINIIYREVSSTRLNLIQDVTVKTGGVIRSVFDYGDVFIQTAGTEMNFEFEAVPHPQQVAQEIEELMRVARQKEGVSNLEKQLKE